MTNDDLNEKSAMCKRNILVNFSIAWIARKNILRSLKWTALSILMMLP
ncbi:MAG: hypothetical protein HXY43_13840 [Fischerella sp.]|nr:hypothetical protein [Fischerella sp.]